MIRSDQLVGLSDLLTTDEPDPVTDQPPRTWRSGWPALLASSAARAVLVLLTGLLLAAVVPALPGWHPTVVQTGSMQPLLQPGDVVIARPVPATRLRPGQVLLVADPDHPGRLRLHRLIRIDPDGRLVLRGDANPAADSSPVTLTAVRGVAVLRVPAVGQPMRWLRQRRYLSISLLATGLAGLLLAAAAFRPEPPAATEQPAATGRPEPPSGGRPEPPGDGPGRGAPRHARPVTRRRFGPAAVAVLAGLIGVPLVHPAPAHASYATSTAVSADSWAAAGYFSCRQAVLADSPTLYYQLNETSGGTVSDSSGNGANGNFSSSGVSLGQPGSCRYDGGTAVSLDGSSGYLYRSSKATAPSTFSWELWFATSSSRGGWLVGIGSSKSGLSGTADRQLYLTGSGQVGFGVVSGSSKRAVLSASGYNDGNWHLADATFSASTGMRLYLDGQLVASDATVISAQSYSGYLRVGYDDLAGWSGAPPSNFFAGRIDEVATYPVVLTATRIGYHYGAGS